MLNFHREESDLEEYSQQERSIIKEKGFCKSTSNPFQLYCSDCGTLLCLTCFFQSHRSHAVSELSRATSVEIFESIKANTDKIHSERVEILEKKSDLLDINLRKIENTEKLIDCYKSLAKALSLISKKIETGPVCRIKDWGENIKEKTVIIKEEIGGRSNGEMKDYDQFCSYLKKIKDYNPGVQILVCQAYLDKKNRQKTNDESYEIEEVPISVEDFRDDLYDIICKTVKEGIDCMMESMKIIGEEISPALLGGTYDRIERFVRSRLENYGSIQKIEAENSENCGRGEYREAKKNCIEGTEGMSIRKGENKEPQASIVSTKPLIRDLSITENEEIDINSVNKILPLSTPAGDSSKDIKATFPSSSYPTEMPNPFLSMINPSPSQGKRIGFDESRGAKSNSSNLFASKVNPSPSQGKGIGLDESAGASSISANLFVSKVNNSHSEGKEYSLDMSVCANPDAKEFVPFKSHKVEECNQKSYRNGHQETYKRGHK